MLAVTYLQLVVVTGAFLSVSSTAYGDYETCCDVMCYYSNEAASRAGRANLQPEDMDPFVCTHIHYHYARVSSRRVLPSNEKDVSKLYPGVMSLKQINPKLQVLLVIGGWHIKPKEFDDVMSSKESMRALATDAINFVRTHGFDGVDLYWVYRNESDWIYSADSNSYKFVTLVETFREAVITDYQAHPGKRPLWLTASFRAGAETLNAHNIENIFSNLDYGLLHTYSYHGSWEDYTGHNAPYYPNYFGDRACVRWSTLAFLENGFRESRLFVGLPTFARSFTLDNPRDSSLGAPARIGSSGQWTQHAGILGHFEICEMAKARNVSITSLTYGTNQLVLGNQWVSYDSTETFVLKQELIRAILAAHGVFVFTIDMDDHTGQSCASPTFPLTRSLNACATAHVEPRIAYPVTFPTQRPTHHDHAHAGHDHSHEDDSDDGDHDHSDEGHDEGHDESHEHDHDDSDHDDDHGIDEHGHTP